MNLFLFKWSESHSVMSSSLRPHGLYRPWNSPGQNTGVGSLSLLQGIFPTKGSNPGLLHCRQILYQVSLNRSPILFISLYIMVQALFCSLSLFPGPSLLCSLWDDTLPSKCHVLSILLPLLIFRELYGEKPPCFQKSWAKKVAMSFRKEINEGIGTNEGFLYRQYFT